MAKSPFLLSISQDMRQKGYSLRTEKTYIHWIKRFILFHGKRHPLEMAGEEVRLFSFTFSECGKRLYKHSKNCS
ncbi:TPA: phage integrase N-terminal SAM-like domain-containing protein [Salmonella enterica]|nr:phage integrase N-terminal SAM-like domain-containing protein [Salmonella enterica]HCL5056020.1 phage integrase N-terminal SAM-like domain-containing protein [Salmonella enterica]